MSQDRTINEYDLTPTAVLLERARATVEYIDRDEAELSDEYWGIIIALHRRSDNEVMAGAEALLLSADSASRKVGPAILAQVRVGNQLNSELATDLLVAALDMEKDAGVMADLVFALGHTPDARAASRLLALVDHPSEDVRFALAYTLPNYREWADVIPSLITFTEDVESGVRDWGTFGLGVILDDDTPELREALVRRLEDEVAEPRGEAMVGLARRGDLRLLPALLRELSSGDPEILREWVMMGDVAIAVMQTVESTGNAAWLPVLLKLKALKIEDGPRLDAAIERLKNGSGGGQR